jgi:hypothetical protein
MPRKQTNHDDDCYENDESRLIKKEINRLKKELRVFKKEKNQGKIKEYEELIISKHAEHEKIIYASFAEDMRKNFPNCILHEPRRVE